MSQSAFTCSKLTIKTLEQGVKYVSKLTTKTPEERQWRRSGVFIVNFEHISQHLFLVFLLLTLNLFLTKWVWIPFILLDSWMLFLVSWAIVEFLGLSAFS